MNSELVPSYTTNPSFGEDGALFSFLITLALTKLESVGLTQESEIWLGAPMALMLVGVMGTLGAGEAEPPPPLEENPEEEPLEEVTVVGAEEVINDTCAASENILSLSTVKTE